MTSDRLWHIATDEFARAVESITTPATFALDKTVRTWQCSYFRFVRSPLKAFASLVDFAAMAAFTTTDPRRPVIEWAREVLITPLLPEHQHSMIEIAREDCEHKDEGERTAPDWLRFDGDLIDGFQFLDRGGPLCDIAEHEVYRTATSYYYLCLNRES